MSTSITLSFSEYFEGLKNLSEKELKRFLQLANKYSNCFGPVIPDKEYIDTICTVFSKVQITIYAQYRAVYNVFFIVTPDLELSFKDISVKFDFIEMISQISHGNTSDSMELIALIEKIKKT